MHSGRVPATIRMSCRGARTCAARASDGGSVGWYRRDFTLPVAAFPKWLQAIAVVDPFTYAIHGFKAILLKDGGFVAIRGDLLFLFAFGIGTLLIATPLFKRTL